MRILGIETSCDETAAAVVEDGRRVLSDVVASQIEVHARYGGIVPEVASRQHLLQIIPVIEQALADADATLDGIDAVAVTRGPGLAGSLMVGVNTAKAIALARGLPLTGVHHIEGHIYAAWLDFDDPAEEPGFPLVALIASGAHTHLYLMRGHGDYTLLGQTLDDASGEAFDKAARILGLGFPGGPAIQAAAVDAPASAPLPRAWLNGALDFSFSGLKTALLHRAQDAGIHLEPPDDAEVVATMARAFQEAVVDVVSAKAALAVERTGARGLILGGGVSANGPLRAACKERVDAPVLIPTPKRCTDNGSMIAAAGYFRLTEDGASDAAFDVAPSLAIA